jgi:hypothetical protein
MKYTTALDRYIGQLGISQMAILTALGQSPSLSNHLKDANTIDKCIELKDQAPKNWPLQIEINDKILSLINCFEQFSYFYFHPKSKGLQLTREQKVTLKELFCLYGSKLIDSLDIGSLDDLFYFRQQYLDDFCIEKARNKRLRLWAEIILTYKTIDDCAKNTKNNSGDLGEAVNKMIAIRARSIIYRILNSDQSTADEIIALANHGFCDTETHQAILIKYFGLLSKELRNKDISFARCIHIFYKTRDIKPKHIAYRAIVMAYKKAKTTDDFREVIKCFNYINLKSSNRLLKKALTEQDRLTVLQLNASNKIEESMGVYSISTHSQIITDYMIIHLFRVAKTSEDYLRIANFLSCVKNSTSLNIGEFTDIALDTALYTAESFEKWRSVWWHNKDQHSPFAYKCLRRLKAFEETQRGVDTVPIVDGLFVFLPLADSLFVIPKNDKITIER